MPNIPSIKIGNTTYNVKDTTAREHLVEVSTTQPSSPDNRLWIKDAGNEYEIPTYDEFTDLKSAFNAKMEKGIIASFSKTGRYINTSGNQAGTGGNYNATDFIDCHGRTNITYCLKKSSAFYTIAFYDSSKTLISGQGVIGSSAPVTGGTTVETVSVPSSAYYCRATMWEPNNNQFLMLDYSLDEILNKIKEIDSRYLSKGTEISFTVANTYIKLNGGTGYSASAKATEYIPCHGNKTILYKLKVANSYSTIAFYDQSLVMISGEGVVGDSSTLTEQEGSVSIPNTAFYFRATMWDTSDSYYLLLNYEIENLINQSDDAPKYLYGDSLKKPFSFNGETALAFGDSITKGVANEGSGNYETNDSYIKLFASYTGLTLTNKAKSASCITFDDDETVDSIYTVVTNTSTSADVIIISGGTNDYNTRKTLGAFGDNTKYTFYGALKLICEYLQTNYPNATVIFITPVNVTINVNGVPSYELNKYRNAIFEVATYYGYNVINGIDMIPVTQQSGYDDTMISHLDGTHPTLKGHALYARNLCMKLC